MVQINVLDDFISLSKRRGKNRKIIQRKKGSLVAKDIRAFINILIENDNKNYCRYSLSSFSEINYTLLLLEN